MHHPTIDSHEFQKTYLNQRAADLDKVIEDHDKQLDIILHAMHVYKNEKEDLTDEVAYPWHSDLRMHRKTDPLLCHNSTNAWSKRLNICESRDTCCTLTLRK